MRCDVHMPKLISLVCWNPNLYARSECWHWVSSFILNIGSMHCDKCQHYPENTFGVYPELSRCLGSFLLKKKLFLSCIQVNRWASGWTSTTSRRWRSWRRSRKTRWWTSPRSTKPWKPGFASDMALTFTLTHTPLVSHALTHAHLKHAHALHFPHTHFLSHTRWFPALRHYFLSTRRLSSEIGFFSTATINHWSSIFLKF